MLVLEYNNEVATLTKRADETYAAYCKAEAGYATIKELEAMWKEYDIAHDNLTAVLRNRSVLCSDVGV